MFRYQKESHASAWTQDYVFQQLIPYIGNKRKLLGLIEQAVARTGVRPAQATFLDMFSGSGVVARMAKRMGFQVWSNDWEPYAEVLSDCFIGCNQVPAFAALGGYEQALTVLNTLPPRSDWISAHLCPDDDVHFDVSLDRMFYTRANGQRLDAMRVQIEEWQEQGLLTAAERSCLLAPLLYQASYTSNTSGVFKAFHKGWGGQTGTALYRILSEARLKAPVFWDNGQPNRTFRQDAQQLALQLQAEGQLADIVYLDPPYNQHPYGSNYHVLNSIALWDKPELTPKISGRNKSAIRSDWRSERRSAYNYRGDAEQAYRQLLASLDARFILTSYSTDGMIALPALLAASIERGHTEVICRPYKRYRVSAQRFSHKPLTVEFILITHTRRKHTGPTVDGLCHEIRQTEAQALHHHSVQQAVQRSGSKT